VPASDASRWFSDSSSGAAEPSPAGKARQRLKELRWLALLAPERARLGYLGWLGYKNVGDEVMFEAATQQLAASHVRPLPPLHLLARLQRHAPRPLFSGLMLGGGTLIGHAELRAPFEDLWRRHPDVPAFVYGSGVEDPALDRSGTPAATRRAELERWAELLSRFDAVGVRGPRSAALLADAGYEAEVIGDSALLLRSLVPPAAPAERVLGLNAGITGALWGNDPEAVIDALAGTVRTFAQRGWEIRLFSVWPPDEPYLHEIARRSEVAVTIEAEYDDTRKILRSLQQCTVFAGLKLHSVVLASAVGVPSVMVEYQPKCADFQDSIGRREFTIRTDAVTTDALVERLDALAAARDRHSAEIATAVDGLCASLVRLSDRIEQQIGATAGG
jgi:hypothetical protein